MATGAEAAFYPLCAVESWRHLVGAIPTRLRASHPGGIECCVRVREDADEAYTERLPGRNRKVLGLSLVRT